MKSTPSRHRGRVFIKAQVGDPLLGANRTWLKQANDADDPWRKLKASNFNS